MDVTAADLLEGGARHRWPDGAESSLVLVPGPDVVVGPGGLVWFDLFNTGDATATPIEQGACRTSSTVVEWPPDPLRPQGARAGAAAVVGDLSAVAAWEPLPDDGSGQAAVGCSYGVGAVVAAEHLSEVADAVAARSYLEPVVERVRADHVAPFELGGRVVGVAFDCGMGSSLNLLSAGRDVDGRMVAVLADLELLHHAESRT